jgi:exopolysaccharide production protein ExoY
LKRGLDIAIAGSMLIILAPVMLMIAALIFFTMGWPIFYAGERVGFNGIFFRCYKFRTMVRNAKDKLAAYLENNPEAASEWRLTQKLKDDPRVTPLGKILRKSSLDELPQLINALRGDMTCVGPRPVTASELHRYGKSARHYLRTRPGLTGLWQVSGRSNTTYRYRVVLDRAYVASWSVWSDLRILLRTAPALFRFRDSA